jgi:hypothetical protein
VLCDDAQEKLLTGAADHDRGNRVGAGSQRAPAIT